MYVSVKKVINGETLEKDDNPWECKLFESKSGGKNRLDWFRAELKCYEIQVDPREERLSRCRFVYCTEKPKISCRES